MNVAKTLAVTTLVAAVLTPVALYISFVGSTEALCERFPDIDPQIVRDVHKELWWEVAKGKYGPEDRTDEEYDLLFLAKVQKLTSV